MYLKVFFGLTLKANSMLLYKRGLKYQRQALQKRSEKLDLALQAIPLVWGQFAYP